MDRSRYYFSAVAAFAVWGIFSLVLRPIRIFAPLDILYYRVLMCLAVLLLIFFIRKKARAATMSRLRSLSPSALRKLVGWNLLAGFFLTSNWFLFIYVMNFVSVRATSLAYLVCPILTAVLANLLLGETMKRLQWMALVLGCAGCAMLAFGHLYDLFLSLLVAISYAIYLIIQKKNAGYDSFVVLTLHVLLSVLLLSVIFPMFSGPLPQQAGFYGYIFLIATCFTILPMFLSLYALQGIRSSAVGMLLNINPILAFSLSVFYFREPADPIQYVAYATVFLSVVLFNLPALRAVGRK